MDRFLKDKIFSENIDFVNKIVELVELLIEYREFDDLNDDDNLNEVKTFYLNELMVRLLKTKVFKRFFS